MKNRILYYLILFSIFFAFNTCKKDYSDNIPKWVKTEIKNFKKITKDCRCYDQFVDNPELLIEEFVYSNETLYVFNEKCYKKISEDILVYDYNGNRWFGCKDYPNVVFWTGQDATCYEHIKSYCTSSRKIWSGKMYN